MLYVGNCFLWNCCEPMHDSLIILVHHITQHYGSRSEHKRASTVWDRQQRRMNITCLIDNKYTILKLKVKINVLPLPLFITNRYNPYKVQVEQVG